MYLDLTDYTVRYNRNDTKWPIAFHVDKTKQYRAAATLHSHKSKLQLIKYEILNKM